jgi:hypothetical protein
MMRFLCSEYWMTIWLKAFCKGARVGLELAGAGWLTQKEVVKRPYFPVTSVVMPPHEPRHSYERCIVCHKPFRVYRSRLLRPGGMFCRCRCRKKY